MKTTIILLSTYMLLSFITACVTYQRRSDALKKCIEDFIERSVPIQEATKACEEIYKNPHIEYEKIK